VKGVSLDASDDSFYSKFNTGSVSISWQNEARLSDVNGQSMGSMEESSALSPKVPVCILRPHTAKFEGKTHFGLQPL